MMAVNPALVAMKKRWQPARYAQITRDFVAGLQQGQDPERSALGCLSAANAGRRELPTDRGRRRADSNRASDCRPRTAAARSPRRVCGYVRRHFVVLYRAPPQRGGGSDTNLSAQIIESGAVHPSHTLMPQQILTQRQCGLGSRRFRAYPSVRAGFGSSPDQTARCIGLGAFFEVVTRLPAHTSRCVSPATMASITESWQIRQEEGHGHSSTCRGSHKVRR